VNFGYENRTSVTLTELGYLQLKSNLLQFLKLTFFHGQVDTSKESTREGNSKKEEGKSEENDTRMRVGDLRLRRVEVRPKGEGNGKEIEDRYRHHPLVNWNFS
jgi:hypothetical protein